MKKLLLLCIWIMTGVIAGCSSETSHTNIVNIDKVEIVA
ncbi:tripartite tricarboxylate transporter substrate binding protein, partial [Priestia sp. SIMBA_032]